MSWFSVCVCVCIFVGSTSQLPVTMPVCIHICGPMRHKHRNVMCKSFELICVKWPVRNLYGCCGDVLYHSVSMVTKMTFSSACA